MEPDDPRRVAAVNAAARRLRVDNATAAAIRALEHADIPSVLLKGPGITRWLYEPGDARAYVDSDLLVPAAAFDAAIVALMTIGFEPELDESQMPAWWREHALTTFRSGDGTMVDLHRNLPGANVGDAFLWSTLSASAIPLTVGDVAARILNEPGRLMHAALHAAQHGGRHRDLDVLARAIDQAQQSTWRAAADLASTLGAAAAFTQGLTLLPEGIRLAQQLELGPALDVDVELRAVGAVHALTVAQLHRTRGILPRVSLVAHKLLPPPTFMRKWSPTARRSRRGLIAAYLYRPIWIARRTPHAVSAWRDARRTIRHRAGGRRNV
jgi:Uncharacterised nucleotidyltransferase